MRMLSLLVGAMVVVVLWMMPSNAAAQINAPYIVQFDATANPSPLSIDAVEAGTATVDGVWSVQNLGDNALRIDQLVINDWQPVVFQTPLQATESRQWTIRHPLNFGPVTYRLVVVGADGALLDQRVAMLEFATSSTPPTIDTFQADASTLDTGRLLVFWEVRNRNPYTNLVFEQVLADGRVVSIEEPRSFAWVPSVGQGAVVPQPVADGQSVRLRLRVIDVLSIDVSNVDVSNNATTVVQRDLVLGDGTEPVILDFSAAPNPVARDGTITVSWQVQNAEIVQIAQIAADGRYLRSSEEINLTGTRTFSPLANDYYVAQFFIYAGDRAGNGVTDTLELEVLCPYTFFVSAEGLADRCPVQAVATFAGAYQLFERGEAIWRGDRNEIVLLYSGGTYEIFPDTYQEGEAIVYPDGISIPDPDSGQTLPIRGFGKVWANHSSARNGLGFAIGVEVGYTITGQDVADPSVQRGYSSSFFTFPDESVVELRPDGTWRKLPSG